MTATPAGSMLLTWGSPDGRMLETVRIAISGRGLRASGHIVRAGSFGATYSVVADVDGITRRVQVQADTADGERSLSLTRNPDGAWVLESATGSSPMPELSPALDVYLRGSAFATSLAIRRSHLHEESTTVAGVAADVELPSLLVEPTEHRGTSEITADGARIRYSGAYGDYDIVVDRDGFLVSVDGQLQRL